MEKKKEMRNGINHKRENKTAKRTWNIKQLFGEYAQFYKEHIKKKHVICMIVALLIFFLFLGAKLPQGSDLFSEGVAEKMTQASLFTNMIKVKIPIVFLILFAGITPFVYLPVIGLAMAYNLVISICAAFSVQNSVFSLVLMCIGAFIQLIGFTLAIAMGIYYCSQTSKKYRYQQHSSFGIKDVKGAIYHLRKQEDKFEELKQKEIEKSIKREKLNVKIPYQFLAVTFIVSSVIVVIGTLFVK